jgi:hypothetical protein
MLQRSLFSLSNTLLTKNFTRIENNNIFIRHASNIRVLLLNDLAGHGSKGEVISVRRGFARNLLVPHRKAGKYYLLDY